MTRDEISALFAAYGPMVYRRARYILGGHEDAEEAAQEVFLRALRTGSRFAKKSQVSTWLYSITTNYCLNQIRDRKRRRELWDLHLPDGLAAGSLASDPDAIVALRRLLAAAPDERWAQAAVAVYLDGMSHAEAGKVLGVSKRTVGNLLERFTAWAREREAAGGKP